MRATRAYLVGFGTAGSILAGAAVLFVIGSAIVAFQGWPKIAGQGTPAAVQIQGGGPVAGSRVSRRLRAVTTATPTATPHRAGRTRRVSAARTRSPAAPGAQGNVKQRRSTAGRSRAASEIRPGPGSPGASASPGGGSGEISLSTPTRPPVSVRVRVSAVDRSLNNTTRTLGAVAGKASGQTGAAVQNLAGVPGQILGGP